MLDEKLEVFKVLVVAGRNGLGKTSLIQKFSETINTGTINTIGVDFYLKNVDIKVEDNTFVAIQIWDMSASKNFEPALPYYLGGTQGIILVFSGENYDTLDDLEHSLEVIENNGRKMPTILISMKNDKYDAPTTDVRIQSFLERYNIKYYVKTSAVADQNIDKAFNLITKLILIDKSFLQEDQQQIDDDFST